jgi:hypothetical protein
LKIFGGHDYYDCGLSLGIDPSITLVRHKDLKVQDILLPSQELEALHGKDNRRMPGELEGITVAFCSKVYRGVVWRDDNAGFHPYQEPETIWTFDKLCESATRKGDVVVRVARRWLDKRLANEVEDYFRPFYAPADVREYMIRHKIAILVDSPETRKDYERGRRLSHQFSHLPTSLAVNPFTLKGLSFAKALDPYTAFQELSMWIGGVLGGNSPETVAITDDKVLAQSHGFDKHSFRGPRI